MTWSDRCVFAETFVARFTFETWVGRISTYFFECPLTLLANPFDWIWGGWLWLHVSCDSVTSENENTCSHLFASWSCWDFSPNSLNACGSLFGIWCCLIGSDGCGVTLADFCCFNDLVGEDGLDYFDDLNISRGSDFVEPWTATVTSCFSETGCALRSMQSHDFLRRFFILDEKSLNRVVLRLDEKTSSNGKIGRIVLFINQWFDFTINITP